MKTLINVLIALACAGVTYAILEGVFVLDFGISRPLEPMQRYMSDGQPDSDSGDFDEWNRRSFALFSRWRFVYLPLITIAVATTIGLLSRGWQWTWLFATIAILPAVVWTVVIGTGNLGSGVIWGMIQLFICAALATALGKYRHHRQTRHLGTAATQDSKNEPAGDIDATLKN